MMGALVWRAGRAGNEKARRVLSGCRVGSGAGRVGQGVRQQRENAIRAQLYGAAPETISRAVEEANSDLEAQRIAVVASRDPFAALAMTEDSTYLLPDAATGLRNKLSPEVERLERQAAAEAEKEAAYAATDMKSLGSSRLFPFLRGKSSESRDFPSTCDESSRM